MIISFGVLMVEAFVGVDKNGRSCTAVSKFEVRVLFLQWTVKNLLHPRKEPFFECAASFEGSLPKKNKPLK